MLIYGQIKQVREAVKEWKREGKSVGFVPTMGYLHEGHKSLIDAARRENDKVVVSIFVNPMQFGPTEDLDSYPRDLNRDAKLCEDAGVDIIFHPEADEMYADGFCSYVDMNEMCIRDRHGRETNSCYFIKPGNAAYRDRLIDAVYHICDGDYELM